MTLKYHTVSAFLLSIVFSLNGCNSDEIDSLNSKTFELTEEINLIKDNAALSNENLNATILGLKEVLVKFINHEDCDYYIINLSSGKKIASSLGNKLFEQDVLPGDLLKLYKI